MATTTMPRGASNLFLGLVLAFGLGAAGPSAAQSAGAVQSMEPPTQRLSPQVRSEALPLPLTSALKRNLIEPFLAEPLVIDEATLLGAPRIVAAQENRVLLSRGDRAYARGPAGAALLLSPDKEQRFSVFRNVKPLRDTANGVVLGYEAQFVGSAVLLASEGGVAAPVKGQDSAPAVPATILITGAKEEMRAGDRLLPRPPSRWQDLVPQPAAPDMAAHVISVYGSAVLNAGQNQIVVLNRGSADGLAPGHVMAIQKRRTSVVDTSDEARPTLQLPEERNGLAMVFLSFDKLAYALVVEIADAVRVGDRLTAP